jgi:peptide/nickel transport system permease protein
MLEYIIRRIFYMIPTLFAISIAAFAIIQLPPGDYLTSMVAGMAAQGETVDSATLAALRARYGLGEPFYVQYYLWISGILLRGDFGQSFEWNRPVSALIWDRLALTLVISLASLLFIWVVAFPIGIYSAVRKYSIGDYIATFIGFIGLATPNFLIALILMYIAFAYFGQSVGGLFSPEYVDAPWSWAKFVDMLGKIWIPMIVIGTAGTAGLIRIMRANLLDELSKPYVVTARAKGVSEGRLLLKYPVRVALNPFVSTVGWVLAGLISGEAIVSIVLSLPTTGPLLLRALQSQDMYLAGSFILMLSTLTVIGTLISDILLAWLDPRIRYR